MSGTIAGSMRAEDGRGVVRTEGVFATDPADLWSALTEPDRLARWIAVVEGAPRLGGTVSARFTSTWEGTLRIDACEPERRLLVTSRAEGEEPTVIEAVLTPEGGRTRLVIEERGLPLPAIDAHGAGWQVHVEDLAALVDGRPPSVWAERWQELQPGYAVAARTL